MIHVCFGLHDKTGHYSKFTGTAMLSLFDNTDSEVTVHILHDNTLTDENRAKFLYVAEQYNQTLKFYNVEQICAEKISAMIELVPAVKTARVSVGAFYRLLIPQLLSSNIEKSIYLDSDMLVNLDLKELWKIELGDKPIAAVREMDANAHNYKTFDAAQKYLLSEGLVRYEDYFNSGLLVMNLKYLRRAEEFIMRGIKWRGEHPQCNCFDQDIWNYLFSKNYLRLPEKFDRFICNERSQGRSQIQSAIYHCTSPTLGLDMSDPFNRLWMRYFMKTPWFNEDTIGKLYKDFRENYIQLYDDMGNFMRRFSATMSNRTRAFFILSTDVDFLKKAFFIRDNEEIIFADNETAIPNLVYSMGKSQGRKLFFILVPNFQAISELLEQIDFVPGKDFLNGWIFLPSRDIPLNSYSLIQAM